MPSLPTDTNDSPNYTPAQHADHHNDLAAFNNAYLPVPAVYQQDSEPVGAPDGSWWIDTDEPSQSGSSVAFSDWTPTWTNLTVGNGTLNKARYAQSGDLVVMELEFTWGSTTSITASQHVRVSLPVAAAAGMWVLTAYYLDLGVQHYVGNALIGEYTANDAGLHHTTAGGAGNVSNSGAPFTWAAGDKIVITGTYEAA